MDSITTKLLPDHLGEITGRISNVIINVVLIEFSQICQNVT